MTTHDTNATIIRKLIDKLTLYVCTKLNAVAIAQAPVVAAPINTRAHCKNLPKFQVSMNVDVYIRDSKGEVVKANDRGFNTNIKAAQVSIDAYTRLINKKLYPSHFEYEKYIVPIPDRDFQQKLGNFMLAIDHVVITRV